MLWIFISSIFLGGLRNVEGFRCDISTASSQSLSHVWMEDGKEHVGGQRLSVARERTPQRRGCCGYVWGIQYVVLHPSTNVCVVCLLFFFFLQVCSHKCVCLFVCGLEIMCLFITAWATEPKDHSSPGLSQPRLTFKVFVRLDIPLCIILRACMCVCVHVCVAPCLSASLRV